LTSGGGGGVPLSLANLTALTQLDFSLNHLTGLFPEVLWESLLRLQKLDLSGNYLTGQLFPSNLADMVNLVRLDLSSNNFSGFVPPSWIRLTRLQALNLQSNPLLGGPFPTLPSSLLACHLAGIRFQCPLPKNNPSVLQCSASCASRSARRSVQPRSATEAVQPQTLGLDIENVHIN
jgi:hypothetical protein